MARSKRQLPSRRMTPEEERDNFETSLDNLGVLAKAYDDGIFAISLSMSTEVHKILTEDRFAIQSRKKARFSTPDFGDESRMLNALHKLTACRVSGQAPILDFLPNFYFPNPNTPTKFLQFKEWWNDDVIYRAGAALPGQNPSLIPVNNSPSVPFSKREKITRREFVSLLRNKLGSHSDVDVPILMDELADTRSWGHVRIETEKGNFDTFDGTLKTRGGIVPAMMRQISHEVLVAYGREDPPPTAPPP